MWISGHLGFTIGATTALSGKRIPATLPIRELATIAAVALLPDILDRLLNLTLQSYPDHCIFHSLLLYGLAIPLCRFYLPRVAPWVGIMAFNVVLDLANVDPRALLFPIFTRSEWMGGDGVSLLDPLVGRVPGWLLWTDPAGHFLIFELIGGAILAWSAWRLMANVRPQTAYP